MVINLSRCLTLSVSVVALSAIPVSAAYFNHDTRLSKSSMIDTNTHTLKSSAQSSAFIKTASVCFITDINDCQDTSFSRPDNYPEYNPDTGGLCEKEGYTKITCNAMQVPSGKCPYDETYIEKCVCKSGLVTCTPPNIGVGEACGGKYEKCCSNTCPAGYDLSNGTCRQASSLKTACGNACYKILNNTCSEGSLTAPAETGGNKNKVVATTECGNSCWQSFSDNCPTGYVKTKAGGKCYETSVSYTPYGSACYQEIPCCGNLCNLTTCPLNGSCSYEACSGKYCFTNCTPQSAWFCTPPSTTDCGALGYKSGAACSGGLKCPFGNYWYCM